jgi:hypothetical protein
MSRLLNDKMYNTQVQKDFILSKHDSELDEVIKQTHKDVKMTKIDNTLSIQLRLPEIAFGNYTVDAIENEVTISALCVKKGIYQGEYKRKYFLKSFTIQLPLEITSEGIYTDFFEDEILINAKIKDDDRIRKWSINQNIEFERHYV